MAAATAAKRQRPQKLSIAGRSSEDKGAGGSVTAEAQSGEKVGRAGAERARGCWGRLRWLGAVTAPCCDPRGLGCAHSPLGAP